MGQEFLETTYDKFTLKVDRSCLYQVEGTWSRLEGDQVVVGVSDFFQTNAGDVAFINLPKLGTKVQMNDEAGNIETIKTTEPLITPVSGTVERINTDLESHPELINQAPYGQGWIMTIHPSNWPGESSKMLSPEAYFEFMVHKLAEKESQK
jgi:glycine cleavage system H protein